MNKHISLFFTLIFLSALLMLGCSAIQNQQYQQQLSRQTLPIDSWKQTAPGLTYQKTTATSTLLPEGRDLFIFQIDPTANYLSVIENPSIAEASSIKTIHQQNNSFLTFNGSFFTPEFNPTGLLINNQKLLHPLVQADLINGIFTVSTKQIPKIYSLDEFRLNQDQISPELDFAIQNGPILINNGLNVINSDTQKIASRTAIGVDQDNNIIVIILRQSLADSNNTISLYQFADLIQNSPQLRDLEIDQLINLDGGPSTGFAIEDHYYPELSKIQNIIITKPLEKS